MIKITDNKIYLIGSFHEFRDRIIEALPGFSFADPRTHRQSSVAKLVCDDLQAAEESPVALAVFPAGKSRGVMSYVEIGVSYTNGNHLIVVDEDENCDPLLKKLADSHFSRIDDAIDYLGTQPGFRISKRDIKSKYPAGSKEPVPLNKVYICGTITEDLETVVRQARQKRPDRDFVLGGDTYQELNNIARYDLVVAHFPGNLDWDRNACLIMGGAYAHDISILLIDEHDWKYPPLQAVARRHGTIDNLPEYLTEVNDLNISEEARSMYEFFKRERARKST